MTTSGRRARLARRIALVVVTATLALLVLPATSPVEKALRRMAISSAHRAGITLEIGRLELRPWRLALAASDVDVTLPLAGEELQIASPTVDISLDARLRLHVIASSPRSRWRLPPTGGPEQPAAAPNLGDLLERSRLASLRIDAAELSLADSEDRGSLAVHAADLRLERRAPRLFSTRLDTAGARLHFDDRDLEVGALAMTATVEGPEIRFEEARLERDGSSLGLTGSVTPTALTSSELRLRLRLASDLVEELGRPAPLQGDVAGSAVLRWDDAGLWIEARLESAAMRWDRLGPWTAAASLRGSSERLTLESLQLEGYGGRAEATADWLLASGHQQLHLGLEHLDLSQILDEAASLRPPFELDLAASLDLETTRWSSRDLAGSGRLEVVGSDAQGGAALRVSSDATFTSSGAELERGRATLGPGRADFGGSFDRDGSLAAGFTLDWSDLGEIEPVFHLFGEPAPPIDLDGALVVSGRIGGSLSEPTLGATLASRGSQVEGETLDVEGTLAASKEAATVGLTAVDRSGGRLVISGRIPWGGDELVADLRAEDVDLCAPAALSTLPVCGRLRADGAVRGTLRSPRVELSGSLEDLHLRREGFAAAPQGEAAFRVVLEDRRLDIDRLDASLDGGRLTARGSWDLDSREIALVIAGSDLPWRADPGAALAALRARIDVGADLAGTPEALRGTAELRLHEASLDDRELPDLAATVTADGASADATVSFSQGALLMRSSTRLERPWPTDVEIDLAAVPSEWLEALATPLPLALTDPVANGLLRASLDLASPAAVTWRGHDLALTATYAERRLSAAPFRADGDLREARIAGLAVAIDDHELLLDGVVPMTSESDFDLAVTGSLPLELLATPSLTATGTLALDLRLLGSLESPLLAGDLRVDEGSGTMTGVAWQDLHVRARFEEELVVLTEASVGLLDGTVRAEGEAFLGAAPIGAAPQLRFALENVDLYGLMPPPPGGHRSRLLVNGDGRLRGQLLDPETLRGTATITSIALGRAGREARNLQPVRVELANGRVKMADLHLGSETSDLRVDVEGRLFPTAGDLTANVKGDVDLADLEVLASSLPGIRITGRGRLDLSIAQEDSGFLMTGSGSLESGSIIGTDPSFLVSDIGARLRFAGETIEVSDLTGRMSGGTLAGEAKVDLRDLTTLDSILVEVRARDVSIQPDEGVQTRFSGEATFSGNGSRYRLDGDLRLSSGLFTRELEGTTSEQQSLRAVRAVLLEEESQEAPFPQRVALNLRLATESDLLVRNEMARFAAAGSLRIGGTLADPEITGAVNTTTQGEIRLGRHTFDLERARVELDAYPDEPPQLDISAVTDISQYTVRVEITGTPDDVQTTLSSPDPQLTQADLSSLLLSGRLADTDSAFAGAELEAQAVSYLGDLFQQRLGLGLVFDTPAALPVLASETAPESRVSVGRKFTEDITLSYSISTDQTESQLWMLDYRPLPRLWLRAIQEQEAYTFEVANRRVFDFRRTDKLGHTWAKPRVASVSLSPDPPLAGVDLARHVHLSPGDRFDYWRAQGEARAITRQLVDLGHRSALVDVRTTERDEGLVDVVYQVEPGPHITFQWLGDDPGEELRRRTERQWGPHLPLDLQALELAQGLTMQLRARNWFAAAVRGRVERDDGEVRILFEVKLGERGTRTELVFRGNENATSEELAAVLPTTTSELFHRRLAYSYRYLRQPIEAHYASLGLLKAQVGEAETEILPDTHDLRVTIPIVEGPRFRVGSLALEGADSLPREAVLAAVAIPLDELFELGPYSEAARRVRRLYREEGYLDCRVESEIHRTGENTLEVRVRVEEGERAYVGRIEIAGNYHTSERTIRRQIPVHTGDPLRASDLTATQTRLYKLGVFRSVDVAQEPVPGTPRRDLIVTVVERNDLLFDYGLRYRTADVQNLSPGLRRQKTEGLEGVTRFQLLEPFGIADTASLSLFAGSDRQNAQLGYQFPHFFGRFLPTRFTLEGERDRVDFAGFRLDAEFLTLTAQQTREISESLRVLYGFQLERLRTDSEAPELRDAGLFRLGDWVRRNKLMATVIQDHRDQVASTRAGWLMNTTAYVGGPAIGASYDFARLFTQLNLYVPLGSGPRAPVWASSYRGGVLLTSDRFFESEDRFTAGGPFSVRGFEPNSLGPRIEIDGGSEVLGGRAVVILNQELRFPLFGDLWGGVFFDAGEVFARPRDIDLGELRESYGLGLRYDLGFGVIRLDGARVIDPREGEARTRVHFTFGQAF